MRIAYPIKLFDGSAMDISLLWRILGRPVENGDYAGTIFKPKLSCAPSRSPQRQMANSTTDIDRA